MRSRWVLVVWLLCSFVSVSHATIFSVVRGIVHDPQHRPIEGAQVEIRARNSDWVKTTTSNAEGEFQFLAVPLGDYAIRVARDGFTPAKQRVVVQSGTAPILHFPLQIAAINQTVEVQETADTVNAMSTTTESMVSRKEIERTPGADRANSFAMITDFVPGAVMVHDQLHLRGGHQVTWLVDGVPVPNTNIASNVAPQFDPKDIDYIEVQRGGYSAEYGDRTFGVFNVVPRSGFERNNDADLVLSYGSAHETNNQFSFGGHTSRFAYTTSLGGYRTDLGLMPPDAQALHDQAAGLSLFTSLIANVTPSDQLRLVTSARGDHYQVPNTGDQEAGGLRDVQDERDAFTNFSWVHTVNNSTLLTVSPFFHFNSANYVGGPNDTPIIPTDDRRSSYFGAQVSLSKTTPRHNIGLGFYGFADRDSSLFGLDAADGGASSLHQQLKSSGHLEALFAEDQFRATSWLSFSGGVRFTHFSGLLSEEATSPRAGVVVRIPRVNISVRGFYGRYYQAPPLSTVAGPLLTYAVQQGFGFFPLHGERDEQREVGVTIPWRGWTLDLDHYHTSAHNFFDHDVLGNSNIFLPLTIASARLRGWEATVRSPQLFHRARVHAAFAHAYAEGRGGVTGGLTDFSPPEGGIFFLDHDQRDTLSTGFDINLPRETWMSSNLSFGSGFLNGNGPAHLGSHATFDFSAGKSFGEKVSAQLSVLNLTNNRYLLDNSNTFGGTHFNYPRQIFVTLRYRFHY